MGARKAPGTVLANLMKILHVFVLLAAANVASAGCCWVTSSGKTSETCALNRGKHSAIPSGSPCNWLVNGQLDCADRQHGSPGYIPVLEGCLVTAYGSCVGSPTGDCASWAGYQTLCGGCTYETKCGACAGAAPTH